MGVDLARSLSGSSGGGTGGGVAARGELQGFSASNYLATATGQLAGSTTGFSACAVWRYGALGGGCVFGSLRQFNQGGWAISCDDNRVKMYIGDTISGQLENYTGADFSTVCGNLIVAHIVYEGDAGGGVTKLYFQGEYQVTISCSNGYQAPTSSQAAMVGRDTQNGSIPLDAYSAVVGCAYGTQVMTAADVTQHTIAIYTAGKLVDDPVSGFSTLYDFTLLDEGACPSTVSDQIGSVDLTLTGSLTVVDRYPYPWGSRE